MNKRTFAVVAVLVLAAVGAALGLLFRNAEPPSVRMAYPPIVASLPLYVAQDQRLFDQKGVGVKQVSFANSNDMVNALVAGEVDILPAVSLIPILHLEARYPGTVRLFSHSRMRPAAAFDSIVVKETASIRKLSDLAGKRIGVFPGTSAGNMLRAFLKKHGVAVDRITLVQLAPNTQLGSLESGAIDALFSYEPITTIAQRQKGFRRLYGSVYAGLLDPNPIGASVVSRQFERKHPDLARQGIGAIDAGVVYMREKPGEAKALLPRFTAIPPEIAQAVNVVDVTLSGENDAENIQRFIDLLVEVGELPSRIDARKLLAPTN